MRGEGDWRHRETQVRGPIEMEAEAEVMCVPAKENQGCGNPQKLNRGVGWTSFRSLQEPTLLTPGLQLLASRTVSEYIRLAFSHPICGSLLKQTQETNTDSYQNSVFKNMQSNTLDDKDLPTLLCRPSD